MKSMDIFRLKWRLYLVLSLVLSSCFRIESSQQALRRSNVRSLGAEKLNDSEDSNENGEVPSLAIDEYVESMYGESQQMLLLQWNSSGYLERTSTINSRLGWVEQFLNTSLYRTSPSEYGKLAFVFVSDVIVFIRWDLRPPIPLMVYTLRSDYIGADNYYLIPNPYDLAGFSQFSVDTIIGKSGGWDITFETFSKRQSKVMWRGGNHGEKVRDALVAFAANEEESFVNGTSDRHWIDARYSFGPDQYSIKEEDLATWYKYHLDVGGVSGTSWEGLRWKMCSGNLVFRVDTNAVDWWHDRIHPGVHYISVNEDFSNLREQYDWAENNPVEAYEVAQRGQKECMESYRRTYAEKFMREMVDVLPAATWEQMEQAEAIFDAENYKN